jgi:PEGA domain
LSVSNRAARRGGLLVLLAALILSWLPAALAQPAAHPPPAPSAAPAAPAAPPAGQASEDAKRAHARELFEKGLTLFDEEAWDAALVEFSRSRELSPTRAATRNAAYCLKKLHRFDESLALYESILRDYPNLSPEDKTATQKAIAELQGLVGLIDVRDTEPGATVVIDGRERGPYPLPGPVRVSAGTHVVLAYKDGFLPFEGRAEVVGGQMVTLRAALRPLTQSGRLRVTEHSGKTLEVLVDGVPTGKTPWEGTLAVGEHTVSLRGEGNLGTQPASAPVELNRTTPLTLEARDLDVSLRVEPAPAGAKVAVDGVTVGRGVWEGRLVAGDHRIEVGAEGFRGSLVRLHAERGARKVLPVTLECEARAAPPPPSRIVFEVTGAPALTPSLGGSVAAACTAPCASGLGLGESVSLHGGYRFGSGIALGLTAGFLSVQQRLTGGAGTIALEPGGGQATEPANDTLRLGGVLVGATASLHLGARFPVLLRLGGGAFFASLEDTRSSPTQSFFNASTGGSPATSPSVTYLYGAPEVRAGYRLSSHVELDAGVTAFLLFLPSPPAWNSSTETVFVPASRSFGTFQPQPLVGSFALALAPGLGLRAAF